ncbi:hypothetical protein C0J52_17020 [Blattella germanica]|nr:hypothetical protein C0J52_17020 [Blattella germanica]
MEITQTRTSFKTEKSGKGQLEDVFHIKKPMIYYYMSQHPTIVTSSPSWQTLQTGNRASTLIFMHFSCLSTFYS